MTTPEHIGTLVGLMLLAGGLGGSVNHYLPSAKDGDLNLKRSLILGLGATAIVPVFLGMVSSDILTSSKENPYKLFFFFGICTAAAISSRAFIRTVTDRLIREIQDDVDEVKNQVAPIIEKETESEPDEEPEVSEPLDPKYRPALRAFAKSQYTLRSLVGVASDASQPPEQVQPLLDDLVAQGHLVETKGKRGRRWYLTKKGKRAYKASVDREE